MNLKMSDALTALRAAAAGARHPLLSGLVRQGLALDNPIRITDAGRASLRKLEDEHWAAIQAEFPSEEEETGFLPEP